MTSTSSDHSPRAAPSSSVIKNLLITQAFAQHQQWRFPASSLADTASLSLHQSWRHCWGPSGCPTPSPPPCPAPTHGSHNTHTPLLLPKTPKKVDSCRHPLLGNRTVIPGMVSKCVSPAGETSIRLPAMVHSHGGFSFTFLVLRRIEHPCCIASLLSGKPAYINNSKSGEGRSVHFLITCETTAAPKEQEGWEGVRSRL